ncbi:MAG: hypothetical protein AAB557_05535 [Patescibacteria group bacterium]
MATSPERSILSDVWQAHQLAGKIHTDGAKPLTRLGGAAAITATGVALEMISNGSTKLIQEKFPSIKFDTLPRLFRELLEDGVVGVTYAIANTQLKEPLPKLKLRHFTTSTIGSVLVVGAEGIGGKLDAMNTKRRADALKKAAKAAKEMAAASASVQSSPDTVATAAGAAAAEAPTPDVKVASSSEEPAAGSAEAAKVVETEKGKSLLDYINPVTALGADEARMAVMDWWNAYKAVTSGTEDAWVKANKSKDPKEPTLTKETTIIFLGNDAQLASALSTVSAEQATS